VRAGGFASNDPALESLAELQAAEVELSERRHGLHAQIDALHSERTRRRL
jgi:cell division protein FtsB